MFIKLSDGTIINTEQIALIRPKRHDIGYEITMACGDVLDATEDEDRIKALVLSDKSKWQGCDRRRHVVLKEFECADTDQFLEEMRQGIRTAMLDLADKPLFREGKDGAIYVTPEGHGQ